MYSFIRRSLVPGIALGVAMLSTSTQAGETFGTSSNASSSTFIPAFDFKPLFDVACTMEYYSFNFHIKPATCAGAATAYFADLSLPEGALITSYRVGYYDNDPANTISVSLRRTYAPLAGGTDIGSETLGNSTYTSSSDSAQYVFPSVNLDDHTYDTWDQGLSRHYNYYARVTMPVSANVRFRGVWVFWQRQIPPAPATASFNDVSTGHPFHREVEQLAKSGITGGCGGGNFCPDATVSRGQMAAFLSRALGLHWDFSTDAN